MDVGRPTPGIGFSFAATAHNRRKQVRKTTDHAREILLNAS